MSPSRRPTAVRLSVGLALSALLLRAPAAADLFTVTSTADGGAGSLREAILGANASRGEDRIEFAIPEEACTPAGVCEILVASDLPAITEGVIVDGVTQPRSGRAPDNVCATLDAPSHMRVRITAAAKVRLFDVRSAEPSWIRGLAIGSRVRGTIGVRLDTEASSTRVQCSHFGVDEGDRLGVGVCLGCESSARAGAAIVGTDGDGIGDLAEGNVFGGGGIGVDVRGAGAGTRIAGNLFGLAADGVTPRPLSPACLELSGPAAATLVGSDFDGISDALETNVIANCAVDGIRVRSSGGGRSVVIAGNRVGIDAIGSRALAAPRRGIRLGEGSSQAVVRRNWIDTRGGAITAGSAGALAAGSIDNCIRGSSDAELAEQAGFESGSCRGTSLFLDGFESGDVCGWKAGTSGPTVHGSGSVPSDQTWSAAGSPHDVTFDTAVSAGATLTLEPCASVRIAGGKGITVQGQLDAPGVPNEPIRIGALGAENWWSLRTLGAGKMDFAWTTIADGGNPLNVVPTLVAMLDIRGDQYEPTQELLRVDHVTLIGSESQGIRLSEGGGFSADSSALTITGSAGAPINSWARAIGTIPPGTYTGNGDDQILIPGSGGVAKVQEDTTMHERGIPYHVGTPSTFGVLEVSSDVGVATLTIEPGVTLRFKKDGYLTIEPFTGTDPASGALVAVGTEADPIVFTSAEESPAAGDWLGIYFGSTPDPGNQIQHAEVRYAGGLSGTGSFSCTHPVSAGRSEAAIRILGGAPASSFVTNTLIADSAGYGFDRGWNGDDVISFAAGNSFENVLWCPETSPIPAEGCGEVEVACP